MHDSHSPHGVIVGISFFIQFKPLETILAAVVFPTPLTPVKRKACATLFISNELLRILTMES